MYGRACEMYNCVVVVVYRWVERGMGLEESAVGKVNRGALILRARLASTLPQISHSLSTRPTFYTTYNTDLSSHDLLNFKFIPFTTAIIEDSKCWQ